MRCIPFALVGCRVPRLLAGAFFMLGSQPTISRNMRATASLDDTSQRCLTADEHYLVGQFISPSSDALI